MCGFVTTLGGGLGGWVVDWLLLLLEHGLTFGVVGDIHIRVCMSNPEGLGMCSSSPHGSLLREQVAVAKFLLADTFG